VQRGGAGGPSPRWARCGGAGTSRAPFGQERPTEGQELLLGEGLAAAARVDAGALEQLRQPLGHGGPFGAQAAEVRLGGVRQGLAAVGEGGVGHGAGGAHQLGASRAANTLLWTA